MRRTRVYLDTCIILYLIEGEPKLQEAVRQHVHDIAGGNALELCTSTLSWLECRIRPLKVHDMRLLTSYASFFGNVLGAVQELSLPVVERGALLRGKNSLSTLDALHVAAALECGADVFATADQKIKNHAPLEVRLFVDFT